MPAPRNVHYTDPLAQERMILQREQDAHFQGLAVGLVLGGCSALLCVALLIGIVRLAWALLS